MSSTVLAIGTKKGLWFATSRDRRSWTLSQPHFLNEEVASVEFDTRQGRTRVLAGVRSEHWGPTVRYSDDLGGTWSEPDTGAIRFPEDTGEALGRVWQLKADTQDRPGVVWAGCEPISVWKSTDGGEHFELNRGLWNHPHRKDWGPGYGGAAAHTVLPSPVDDSIHVAISAGGVYRSTDGGASWQARNNGISAYFMPDPNPEFGQCVHKIARDPSAPGTLYAQNHHGVYRSEDAGDNWESIADGLPADFGFVMLTHPRRGGTAWVIPLTADGERVPPGGHLAMYRTDDGGSTWTALSTGLPSVEFNAVLRDAACVDDGDPSGVHFGTRGGSVYTSADEGNSFTEIGAHLPDVLCVRVARLEK